MGDLLAEDDGSHHSQDVSAAVCVFVVYGADKQLEEQEFAVDF